MERLRGYTDTLGGYKQLTNNVINFFAFYTTSIAIEIFVVTKEIGQRGQERKFQTYKLEHEISQQQ